MAGVSTATITRVLRSDPNVSPQTRERVQAVLKSTGYQVNAIAQSLRTRRAATVAHILHGLFPNPFYTYVARGLQSEATAFGYEVLVYDAEDSPKLEREAVQAALRRRVDAIIFTTALDAANVALATDAGIRAVQVERPTDASSVVVTVDNYCGAREAADHLVALGHRSIAFIGRRPEDAQPSGVSVEAERLQGYLDAVRAAGISSQVLFGEYSTREVDFQSPGRRYAEEIMAGATPPTAIFAASDLLAAGVLQVLYARGIRVPDTVSVIGFDDTYAAALTPPLTTVAVPMHSLGQAAFRCAVIETLEHEATVATRLVLRESTGPPPGEVEALAKLPDSEAVLAGGGQLALGRGRLTLPEQAT